MVPCIYSACVPICFPAGAPNYFPNSFSGPDHAQKYLQMPYSVAGYVDRYNTHDEDNYTQVATFWSKVIVAVWKFRNNRRGFNQIATCSAVVF